MSFMIQGFRGIVNFNGRNTRSQFWWYALTVGIVYVFLNIGLSIYVFIQAVLLDTAAREGKLTGTITAAQQDQIVQQIIQLIFKVSVVPFIVVFLLLAAAIVRRLHDIDKSGILLFSLCVVLILHMALIVYVGPNVVSQPDLKLWVELVLWLVSAYEVSVFLVMIIALCRESDPFDNQFGKNPNPYDFEALKESIRSINIPIKY